MISLDGRATFDVAEHGRRNRRAPCGDQGAVALGGRVAGRKAVLRCYSAAFRKNFSAEVTRTGGDNITECAAHETANAGGCCDEGPLFPHLLRDRRRKMRIESVPG